MNVYVLFSLLFFLAPGGCPMYSIDLSTLEVPNDFQNELTLQSMLSSELHQYRNKLNENAKINVRSAFMSPFENRGELPQSASLKVSRSANAQSVFLGTNLFGNYPKKCFSTEDIALMSARKDFESLIPKSYPQCMLSDSVVYMLMKYFNTVNQIIKHKGDDDTRRVLQRAFFDALGGYLRYYLLPVAQFSYYAGRLKLCTIERLVALYRQCKVVLNTNGNGWRIPVADTLGQLQGIHINPVKIDDGKSSENDAASCALLDQSCVTKETDIEQVVATLPRLEPVDSNGFLGNIFVPFRQRRIYNLQSPNSAFILVKFFKIVTNCHRFQGLSQRNYNLKLRNWIRENVQVHYKDEIFYPGLGGILQIYETLSAPKKGKGKEEDQEPFMSDQDSKDYTVTLDDITSEGEKCAKISNKAYNLNEKKIPQSRKQSRSPKQSKDATNDDPEDSQDRVLSEMRNKHDGEDCIECDDEMYVAYVAAFLALLLLLLLLFICLCMRKSDRERKQRLKAAAEKAQEKEEEPAPTYTPAPQPKSGCGSLFQSKKKAKENASKHRQSVNRQPKGMGLLDNRRDYYSRPLGYTDSGKSTSGKTEKTESDAELDDSFTSTSSLGCRFPRKCLPIKVAQDERDEYYTTSEKTGSNSPTKQRSNVWGRQKKPHRHDTGDGEGSKQKDRFIARPPGISEDHSSPRRYTPPPKRQQASESQRKKQRSLSGKPKRAERRQSLDNESEPEKQRRGEETKSRTDEQQLRNSCEEYKELKRKGELANGREKKTKANDSEIKTNGKETRESEADNDNRSEIPKKRNKDKAKPSYYSSGRERGGGNSKNSLSWETTFDDDSS